MVWSLVCSWLRPHPGRVGVASRSENAARLEGGGFSQTTQNTATFHPSRITAAAPPAAPPPPPPTPPLGTLALLSAGSTTPAAPTRRGSQATSSVRCRRNRRSPRVGGGTCLVWRSGPPAPLGPRALHAPRPHQPAPQAGRGSLSRLPRGGRPAVRAAAEVVTACAKQIRKHGWSGDKWGGARGCCSTRACTCGDWARR